MAATAGRRDGRQRHPQLGVIAMIGARARTPSLHSGDDPSLDQLRGPATFFSARAGWLWGSDRAGSRACRSPRPCCCTAGSAPARRRPTPCRTWPTPRVWGATRCGPASWSSKASPTSAARMTCTVRGWPCATWPTCTASPASCPRPASCSAGAWTSGAAWVPAWGRPHGGQPGLVAAAGANLGQADRLLREAFCVRGEEEDRTLGTLGNWPCSLDAVCERIGRGGCSAMARAAAVPSVSTAGLDLLGLAALERRAGDEAAAADCVEEARRRFVALDDLTGLAFLADHAKPPLRGR